MYVAAIKDSDLVCVYTIYIYIYIRTREKLIFVLQATPTLPVALSAYPSCMYANQYGGKNEFVFLLKSGY